MPHADLLAHNEKQFKKSVIELAPGVWTAVGYAASNVHMIEGKNSVTIIDTSESTKAAENILAAFRKHSTKPIARIIFTHSHREIISLVQRCLLKIMMYRFLPVARSAPIYSI